MDDELRLESEIAKFLEAFDPILGEASVPLAQRPLLAGAEYVEHFVVSLSDHPQSEYLTSPHFAVMYHHISAWYAERYGTMMKANPTRCAVGVVKVMGQPVEFRVPLVVSQVIDPGQTASVSFPSSVAETEDPIAWLSNGPNLQVLTRNQTSALRAKLTKVATSLRVTRTHLMGIEPEVAEVIALLDGVLTELETAAMAILQNTPTGRRAAMWPLQMALERTMKAFGLHKTGILKEGHGLYYLFDFIAPHCIGVNRDKLSFIPSDRTIIDGRYGLSPVPTFAEALGAYDATLEIVSGIAKQFTQKFPVGNVRFKIQKPPWTTLPGSQGGESEDPAHRAT